MPKKLSQFWQELKRRKVLYFLAGYLTACVAIIELSSNASDTFSITKETVKLLYLLSAAGIPVVILLPWYINRKKTAIKTDESEYIEVNDKSDKPQIQKKSIIVLPFKNISSDPEQEYFSEGLTEEIITDLSYINDLLVISRSSAMTFKGSKQTIKEIAGKVKVRYVLEGSVRKSGNDLRIVAQLIDAESDAHMWAEKYNGTLDNVFDIQEKVSKSIAEALNIKINPVEQKRISEVTIENVQAYECYLQARQEIYRFTENGLERGIHLIKNGLEIIGENEILYAAMGTAYFFYIDAGIKPGTDYLQKIEECALIIFKLNPESSHGYFLSGAVHFLRKNLQQAVLDLNKSLEKNPNNPDCLNQLVRIYLSCGKNEAARNLLNKTLEIDPFNAIAFSLPGYLQLLSGDFDSAKESYYKMYRMDPEGPIYGSFYAWALFIAGRNDEAIKVIDGLEKAAPNSIYTQFGLLIKFAVLGQKERAWEVITPQMESVAKVVEYQSRAMTQAYALLGEKELALNWLENTIECGFINYPFLSEIDPFLENIRGENRFKKIMKRVKHEWENFEV